MTGAQDHDRAGEDRLTRLEEQQLYAERTSEQLGGEIAELNRRLASMSRRLDLLERRLGKCEEGGTEGVKVMP